MLNQPKVHKIVIVRRLTTVYYLRSVINTARESSRSSPLIKLCRYGKWLISDYYLRRNQVKTLNFPAVGVAVVE